MREDFFPDHSWAAPKQYFKGTHRTQHPDTTLEGLNQVASKVGITRVACLTGLDRIGIPVVAVCRPRNRSLSVYQGKGLTLPAAQVSGMMESIEQFCGEYLPPPDMFGSHVEMARTQHVLDAHQWPLALDAVRSPEVEIGWVLGVDLLNEQPVFVPHPIVSFDRRRLSPGSDQYVTTSTGLSCGNTFAEALVHALCEVIERDAVTLWRLLPRIHKAATRISLASIADTTNQELIATITEKGLRCAVWDIRTEIDVPVFAFRIVEPHRNDLRAMDLVDGTGCHPDRNIALTRAITEAVQIRATIISGARNDLFRRYYRQRQATDVAEVIDEVTMEPTSARSFEDVPTIENPAHAEDLDHLVQRTGEHFHHMIAVNLSNPQAGNIPAVRVLVPELEDGEDREDYRPRRRALRTFLGRR